MFTGVKENILSRLTYIGIRNTLYKLSYDKLKPKKLTNDLNIYEKSLLGSISGIFGTIASNMFEC